MNAPTCAANLSPSPIDGMHSREIAEAFAKEGLWVFRLKPGDKRPARTGWQREATCNPDAVRELWGDGNWNIGIFTGKFGDAGALLVIDVDNKNGKNGDAALLALELDGREFPPTLENATPTGGRHLVYRVPAAVRQGVDVLGSGLDTRSHGGYIVAPGSTLAAGVYGFAQLRDIALAPAWLIEACGTPRTRSINREPKAGIDSARAEKRAVAYLTALDEVTEGGRNDAAFKAAAKVKNLGCDQAVCVSLMLEHWPCVPMLDLDELQTVVASAYRGSQDPQGSDAPEAAFSPVLEAKLTAEPVPAWVADMNDRYFVVNEAGKPVVMRRVHDAAFDRRHFERSTFDDLKKLYLNRTVPKQKRNLAAAWLGHKHRRDYLGGLVFAPGKDVAADQYNLWQGFGVEPTPGDWSLLRNHTHDVVCQGNAAVFDYLMNWMARAVQEPSKQGETAVVMQSGEGTGKGILARAMVKLFGQHGMQLTQAKHVTSNFNAHMRDLCFLFGDEAFFAGDRSHEGVLKGLITEPTLTIEGKFQNAVTVPNMLHIMLASNEKWVVPAGKDDRRYLMLEVAETHKNKPEYFVPMYEQLDKGGYAAMLHELLNRDISRFNVRRVPSTKAHIAQKRMTLRGVDAWVDDVLERGSIGAEPWTADGLEIPTQDAYDAYEQFHNRSREFRREQIGQWSQSLAKLLGEAHVTRTRPRMGSSRPKCLKFAPLADCRAAFEKALGGSVPWTVDSGEAPPPAATAAEIFD